MKLLITGGAGFIGSNFILYWMKHHPEDQIVNIDKLTYAGNLENLQSVAQKHNYTFIRGDICDAVFVLSAMDGVDTVVHFAAESHVDRSISDPAPFIRTNVLGTYVMLECALKRNVKRFHHVSTDEVYGSLEHDTPTGFNELSLYNPSSPYSASKAASDHLAHAYFKTYGLPVTISNCSNNYGPYQFPEKLIPLAITNILEGSKVPMYGDGLNVRDWLYVDDHASAIETILLNGKIGETYCVGGLVNDINNLEVVHKIITIMKANPECIEFIADRQGHDRKYAINWSKINSELGWKPKHDFDTWLLQTTEWYQKHETWWQHVKSGKYRQYYEKQYGGEKK